MHANDPCMYPAPLVLGLVLRLFQSGTVIFAKHVAQSTI